MIPLKLTIEGIYSYQDRQTIDFTNLTAAGLFGIFGPTGSGKSSILEAISFALYGETERLKSRGDDRAYNMMNLKSKRSYLEFDFENHEGEKFRATREFKRNSKNFDVVKPTNTVFYKFENDDWQPLDHTDAERILGLSYKNFKRTIIIPQGQFKDFLQLDPSDRNKMMKEIFQLERFDLGDKVGILKKANDSELKVLEGKLSGFEEVNPEVLENLEKQRSEQTSEVDQAEKNFNEIQERFHHLELLKTDFETLQSEKSNLIKLTNQIPEIEKRQTEIDRFELFFRAFDQPLKNKNKLTKEIEERKRDLEGQRKVLSKIKTDLEENTKALEQLKPAFEKLGEQRILENDLDLVIKILTGKAEISKLNERTAKGLQIVQTTEGLKKNIEEEVQKYDQRIQSFEAKKLNTEILLQVDSWFTENRHLSEQIKTTKEKLTGLRSEITALNQQLNDQDQQAFETDFEKRLSEIKDKKEQTNLEICHLEVQKQLSKYAHDLHDGEACPLCGSPDHPHIADIAEDSSALNVLKNQLQKLSVDENALQKQRIETLAVYQKLALKKGSAKELVQEIKNLEDKTAEHLKSFIWPDFDANDEKGFQNKRSENTKLEQQLKTLKQTLANKRIELDQKNHELEKYRNTLEKFKIDQAQKQTEINQNLSNIQQVKFEDFESQSIAYVTDTLADLKKENKEIEQNYTTLLKQIAKLNPQVSAKQAEIKTGELYLNQSLEELTQVDEELDKAFELHKVNLPEVERTLDLNLDIPKIRGEINQFRIDLQTLQNKVNTLNERLKTEEYSEDKFIIAQDQKSILQEKLKTARESLTKTKSGLERLTKAFNEKKQLLEKYSKLEKRAQNLQVLSNLFKGAGFVQYVSAIYLRQLCDHANVRFQRMTRNQLSLQVNENNDFEIIDYLNEGRSRSVKTLSGGQAFQVSLSLALALAESVQSHAKAEKNFFFIDEGFGTQDLESVNLVFETLQHLQRENRIVGIISHVEELKEKIPLSLNIVKDEQRGSLIYTN